MSASEQPGPSKKPCIGVKGKTLHSQAREMVANVIAFMKKEAEGDGPTIPLKNVQQRVVAATKISKKTYQKITQEAKLIDKGSPRKFSTPHKKRPKASPKSSLGVSCEKSVRDMIHDFYIIEKRRPTLRGIYQKLQATVDFDGKMSTLRKLVMKLGFRWKRTADNRKTLVESYDIRLKRTEYLKQLKKYKEEGRPIIFTDETYLHSTHTAPKGWTDDSSKSFTKPVSKGRRLIILHAGSRGGFIPNGLLIFKSGLKSGDYHDDMNATNFKRWLQSQLIPNLPPNSVLVLDNASYHNVEVNKAPTTATKKADMILWLQEREIQFDPGMTKPELYAIIQQYKSATKTYEIDVIMEEHGHKVLRLPPYHPELNPIEKIWAKVKNWIAQRNITFKLEDVKALAEEKFASITPKEWEDICKHVGKVEMDYMEKEHLFDEVSDSNLRFTITDSSDEESFEEDAGEKEGDDSLHGIEPLEASDSD